MLTPEIFEAQEALSHVRALISRAAREAVLGFLDSGAIAELEALFKAEDRAAADLGKALSDAEADAPTLIDGVRVA